MRTVDTWERVRETVTPAGVLGEGDHYELFVNPYAGKDGEHRLVVTRRSDCPEPAGEPQDKLERHPLTELASKLPITGVLLRFAARHWPALLASRFDAVLADMADDAYDNVSYKVFNIGEANRLPAVSMELGVTLEGDRHLETVDRILAIAARRRKEEKLVHTSPIALRFVAPSRACASMMQGQPTMMIELILVDGTRGGDALLAGYEEELADLGVRPHWGQINALTPARVRELYPRWEEWLAVERELNASGRVRLAVHAPGGHLSRVRHARRGLRLPRPRAAALARGQRRGVRRGAGGLEPGARVLDCACGTGTLAVGLALRGFEVTASDASPEMVARTQALAAAHGAALQTATRTWAELDGERFDAVLCVGNSLTHAGGRAGRRRRARRHAPGVARRRVAGHHLTQLGAAAGRRRRDRRARRPPRRGAARLARRRAAPATDLRDARRRLDLRRGALLLAVHARRARRGPARRRLRAGDEHVDG